MSIVLDLAAVIMLVVCAIIYKNKGLAAGLVVLVGTLAAMLVAILLANQLSPTVFENFFRESLEERTVQAIGEQSANNLGELLRNVLSFLPESTVDSIVENFGASVDFGAADMAHQVVEEIIAPLIIPIISIIVFFVVFSLIKVVVGLIGAALSGVNKVPLVGTLNRAAGAAMGIFIGAMYVFLVLCVIWALDAAYGGGAIGTEYFGSSILYKITEGLNIFA